LPDPATERNFNPSPMTNDYKSDLISGMGVGLGVGLAIGTLLHNPLPWAGAGIGLGLLHGFRHSRAPNALMGLAVVAVIVARARMPTTHDTFERSFAVE